MRHFCLLAVFLACFVAEAMAHKNFVLLVAGSNNYMNYRHQADICHAYQIVHKHGIPDEQIVVMMYDDIAYNKQNPSKGQIFNKPGGPNVYAGVPKDYTGKHVNPDVFYAVLQGNKELVKELTGKEGKVIESGPDDNIFIYYADHGSVGLVGMPSGLIHARTLNEILEKMYREKKYAKLTFYMEACFSGSMFHKLLPKDINVYAVTSASPHESSYGCYCDNDTMATCLGDTFSVSWMEDTDVSDMYTETFENQFHRVYDRAIKGDEGISHPNQYGDHKFKSSPLSMFMAEGNSHSAYSSHRERISEKPLDAVPSDLIGMVMLQRRISRLPYGSSLIPELQAQLEEMELMQKLTFDLFIEIVQIVLGVPAGNEYHERTFFDTQDIGNYECYYTAVDVLVDSCPKLDININTFFLRNLQVLVNLCNHQPTDKILSAALSAAHKSQLCH